MVEELSSYLSRMSIKTAYIHSDVDTMKRVEILEGLRKGDFNVLVGVNLLREGLDLPEVGLVAILDADKEGFLRSEKALTQTAGRAARNLNGKVIMYADKHTNSMNKTLDETTRRREKQLIYNEKHSITPKQIIKAQRNLFGELKDEQKDSRYYSGQNKTDIAADPVIKYMDEKALKKACDKIRKQMEKAASKLDFIEAARLRDELFGMEKILNEKLKK